MKSREVVFWVLLAIAVTNSAASFYDAAFPVQPSKNFYSPGSPIGLVANTVIAYSGIATPVSWILVLGAWSWKGRTRTKWTQAGMDYDAFKLLVRMKGSGTRYQLLKSLETPRDRLQLAKELRLDWKTVDAHIQVLLRYGVIREKVAYGDVKAYELTILGNTVLGLVEELFIESPATDAIQKPQNAESG
ncbi:MAG TPA: hypothetical protein VFE91_03025 [Nitrososphaerales archaeon]|nr:hypothetical protein [Nitrososphaerales archaeon]